MTFAPSGPTFSVREIPFSYHGSWFGISPVIGEGAYADDLHLVSHQIGMHPVLRLVPTHADGSVRTTVAATPGRLVWSHGSGQISAAYETTDTVRLRGEGLGMRVLAAAPELTPFRGTYLYREPADGAHVFTVYETGRRYRVTLLSGGVSQVSGSQALGVAERGVSLPDGEWEIAIEEYTGARPPYTASARFDQVANAAQESFDAFLHAVAPWRGEDTPAAALAAYVLWSATVRPAGFITRPAVLMSKHWMDKVWSWDHCFNALALTGGRPELAWDQFKMVFDHQDEAGCLPDSVTHSEVLYNFVKPPIHGWALRQLRTQVPQGSDRAELAEVYQQLERWTTFWLTARRAPGQHLPHYQHGNDSGWDNATTFDPERVVQSADLATFLTLQMRELADIAAELGDRATARRWAGSAQEMCDEMLRDLWDGDRFLARGVESGRTWHSASLLDLMPIALGASLPRAIRAAIARRIWGHLTDYGLATESTSSRHYQADGYWRGPIWAPATVLIEDGLRRGGYHGLADTISARFRRLCEKSGFAENFDARTGAALRDRAYTWTASSYLILAAASARRQGALGVPAREVSAAG